MSGPEPQPPFVWGLFQQLRRRGFPLGPDDLGELRAALLAGFGWSSRRDLRALCVALWAKSREEQRVVAALFDQYPLADWDLESEGPRAAAEGAPSGAPPRPTPAVGAELPGTAPVTEGSIPEPVVAEPAATGRLPALAPAEMPALPFRHVFLPQYPVGFRSVAQAWRRLRWSVREGPATELDVDATVHLRSRRGVVCPPVLRPRRRNRAKVVLLVDRKGSMAPFHSYVDEVCEAIGHAGGLGRLQLFYFHDQPVEGADESVLERLAGGLRPPIDAVLDHLPATPPGTLWTDRELTLPVSWSTVLSACQGAAVGLVSDAGAARGGYDLLRLLDTAATLADLLAVTRRVVWLNPVSSDEWRGTTAAELARHLPMFAMDRDGMHRAVNVLRGHPHAPARPIPASRGPRSDATGRSRR